MEQQNWCGGHVVPILNEGEPNVHRSLGVNDLKCVNVVVNYDHNLSRTSRHSDKSSSVMFCSCSSS